MNLKGLIHRYCVMSKSMSLEIIVSMGKCCSLGIDSVNIKEIVEDHKKELIMEDLTKL